MPSGGVTAKGAGVNAIKSLVCCLLLSACFTPEQRFDDFVERKKVLAADAGMGDEDADIPGNDQPLTAEQVAGTYLYAISTPLNPAQPVVYLAEVEATPAQDDFLDIRIRQRPLAIADRKTPVGDWSDWTAAQLEPVGTYETPPITTVVPAAANTFGLPLTTTISFKGRFQNPATPDMPDAKVEFFCGTASGLVEGLNVPLDGSTFASSRIADPADTSSYPPVYINCNKDLAAPL